MVNSGLCSNPILLGLLVGGLVHLFNVSQQPVGLFYYTGCIFNLVNFDSSLIQRKKGNMYSYDNIYYKILWEILFTKRMIISKDV